MKLLLEVIHRTRGTDAYYAVRFVSSTEEAKSFLKERFNPVSWKWQEDENHFSGTLDIQKPKPIRLHVEVTKVHELLSHEEMQRAMVNAGFFFRDDKEIREGVESFKGAEEAYSLFSRDPLERHRVFAGSLEWATEQAYEYLSAANFNKENLE